MSNQEAVRENQVTKKVFYIGAGALAIGILFRVMHWPFAQFLIIGGALVILLSYVLGLFLPTSKITREVNDDILDDVI